MHKETILHTVTATALGTFVAYLSNLAVPTVVLIVVMLVDYGTGMLNAWLKNELNSRIGILGILKKDILFCVNRCWHGGRLYLKFRICENQRQYFYR